MAITMIAILSVRLPRTGANASRTAEEGFTVMRNYFKSSAASDIDRLIAITSKFNQVGRVELLRAVRAGVISLVEPEHAGQLPLGHMKKLARPTLVLIVSHPLPLRRSDVQ